MFLNSIIADHTLAGITNMDRSTTTIDMIKQLGTLLGIEKGAIGSDEFKAVPFDRIVTGSNNDPSRCF